MTAAAIMALVLTTSITTIQAGYKQVDVARGTTLAAQILQSEMERLRLMSWTNIYDMMDTKVSFDGATYFSNNSEVAGKYTITRVIEADSTRPTEVMNITVYVTWSSYDNRSHTRSLTAIYAQNGLYDYYYTVAHP